MNATRHGLSELAEWICAVLVIVGGGVVVTSVIQESRHVRPVVPVIASAHVEWSVPAAIPAGAVNVPLLVIARDRVIRVGDEAARLTAILGTLVPAERDQMERIVNGVRTIRSYVLSGRRTWLVLEPQEPDSVLRVAAIYLQ